MEKLRQIAETYYETESKSIKGLADRFFNAMDEDHDGQVDLNEFMQFMKKEGHEGMTHPAFFDFLDDDHNGSLDFWEVMTLYYIIISGRPFCKSCNEFLAELYFACVECYDNPKGPYCLCDRCYKSFNWAHNHNRCPRFLDNYAMLETKRKRDVYQPRPTPLPMTQTSNAPPRSLSSNVIIYNNAPTCSSSSNAIIYNNNALPLSSSSNAIVLASSSNNKLSLWRAAFKTFEAGLSLANLGFGLSFCSIM